MKCLGLNKVNNILQKLFSKYVLKVVAPQVYVRESVMPSVMTNLASWQLLLFSSVMFVVKLFGCRHHCGVIFCQMGVLHVYIPLPHVSSWCDIIVVHVILTWYSCTPCITMIYCSYVDSSYCNALVFYHMHVVGHNNTVRHCNLTLKQLVVFYIIHNVVHFKYNTSLWNWSNAIHIWSAQCRDQWSYMCPANERCRYIVRMSLIGWCLPRLIPDYGY